MVAPWRLCRQCCCRYGAFPLLVVPIVTLGCCLSLYSSAGCKFVDIDIGFQPTNEGWDASAPYSFGPLFYHNQSMHHDNRYRETFHDGCVSYSDSFFENFIEGDRTFRMIRMMTLISCGSSILAMFVSWIFVISPVPAGLLWPGLLLPSVMVAFISEGSKFLLFDSAACRQNMWYRGSLQVAERAESCSMGESAWFACAAGILHFWALVCVCLRAPERRTLHQTLGPPPMGKIDEGDEHLEETSDDNDVEGDDDSSYSFLKIEDGNRNVLKAGVDKEHNGKELSTKVDSYAYGDIVSSQQGDANDLSLTLVPIETNISTGEPQCCSPMSASKPVSSPDSAPDIPAMGPDYALSPVDCIIEGFDVATDLSQIDVCRTMVYSPTRKTLLELEDGVVEEIPTEVELGTETSNVDTTSVLLQAQASVLAEGTAPSSTGGEENSPAIS